MSSRFGHEYVVQPLPVEAMGAAFSQDGSKAVISWKPVKDPLEPTAEAKGYILYTRIDDGAFDNGTVIKDSRKNGHRGLCIEREISEGVFEGHMTNYIKVHVKFAEDISKKIIDVKIEKCEKDYLVAKIN